MECYEELAQWTPGVLLAQCSFFLNITRLSFWGSPLHSESTWFQSGDYILDIRDGVHVPDLANENSNPLGNWDCFRFGYLTQVRPIRVHLRASGAARKDMHCCNNGVAEFMGCKDE